MVDNLISPESRLHTLTVCPGASPFLKLPPEVGSLRKKSLSSIHAYRPPGTHVGPVRAPRITSGYLLSKAGTFFSFSASPPLLPISNLLHQRPTTASSHRLPNSRILQPTGSSTTDQYAGASRGRRAILSWQLHRPPKSPRAGQPPINTRFSEVASVAMAYFAPAPSAETSHRMYGPAIEGGGLANDQILPG